VKVLILILPVMYWSTTNQGHVHKDVVISLELIAVVTTIDLTIHVVSPEMIVVVIK
jgi:hypothetical protein